MDKITVEEAVEFLNWHNYNCSTCHKIAAMIKEQQQKIDRLKLLCEQKTIENCKVIKQSFVEGVGRPEIIDGKCEGYAISDWDDEPHDSCKECIAGMESEEAWEEWEKVMK